MNRRRVLQRLLGAMLFPAGLSLRSALGRPQSVSTSGFDLLTVLDDRASAAVIGRRYLLNNRQEADSEWLASQLKKKLGEGPWSPSSFKEKMAETLKQEFGHGETVRVDGWVISRTEARLCAIAAIASEQAL
jgi:hypothetical protein